MKDKLFGVVGNIAGAGADMLGYSDAYRSYITSGYVCPQCHQRLLNAIGTTTLKFISATGEQIPIWQGGALRAVWGECPKCAFRMTLRKDGASPQAEAPKILTASVIETNRVEASFGTDTRIVDNSKSSVVVKRTFTISKEWSSTFSVEYEKGETKSGGWELGSSQLGSLKVSCEEALKNTYSLQNASKQMYSEQVEIAVPGATNFQVQFHWKKLFQCGYLEVHDSAGGVAQYPFKVVVGLTFDQTEVDANSVSSEKTSEVGESA